MKEKLHHQKFIQYSQTKCIDFIMEMVERVRYCRETNDDIIRQNI